MIKKPKTSGEGQNLKEETPVRQIDTPLRWLGQWMHGLQGQTVGPAPAPPMSRGRQNFLARYSLCPSCHCAGQISEISDLTAFVLIAFLLIAPFRAPEYKLKLLQRYKFAVVINKYLII